MNRMKYLAKNTLIFTLGNFGSKLISFVLVRLYTDALTKEQYGIVDLITTICMVLVPIIYLNINEAVMRFSLDEDANPNEIMSIANLIMLVAIVPGALFACGTLFYPKVAPYALYVFLYAISMGTSQVAMGYLRGREYLLKFSIGSILQTLFIAVFNILFLLVFKMGIEGYLTSYILAYTLTAGFAFIAGHTFDTLKHFHINKKLSGEMIKYSIVLVPNSFMWWIMNSADRFMVTEMRSTEENGVYAVSYKLPTIVSVMAGVFNQAYSYSAIKENNSEDRDEYNGRVYDAFFTFMIFVGMGLLIILKPLMSIYVAEEFYEAWLYSPPLILGSVLLALGTFLANFYVVNKDSKGFMLSATTGAVLNIVLNVCLIPLWGALGAAIATCASYMAVYIYRYFDVKKYVTIRVFSAQNVLSILVIIAACFAEYLPLVYSLPTQGALVIVFFFLKRKSVIEVFRKLLEHLKKEKTE